MCCFANKCLVFKIIILFKAINSLRQCIQEHYINEVCLTLVDCPLFQAVSNKRLLSPNLYEIKINLI